MAGSQHRAITTQRDEQIYAAASDLRSQLVIIERAAYGVQIEIVQKVGDFLSKACRARHVGVRGDGDAFRAFHFGGHIDIIRCFGVLVAAFNRRLVFSRQIRARVSIHAVGSWW